MSGTPKHNRVRYRFLLAVFCCYVPVMVGFGLWSWYKGTLSGNLRPVCIILGVLCWTLIEYVLHRFVLHLRLQANAVQRTIERLHLGHHREPRDEAKVTVPVYGSLPIAAALLGVFRLSASSWETAGLLMIGCMAGYLWYETVHFSIHCSRKRGRWLCRQRTNHFFHHFRDQGRCFGVTTPVWDWVYRTGRGGREGGRPIGLRGISRALKPLRWNRQIAASMEKLEKSRPV
jgi:sterol desaturase/sphingolipid hydroxylase (fatty acid hydroxylase superfamily)